MSNQAWYDEHAGEIITQATMRNMTADGVFQVIRQDDTTMTVRWNPDSPYEHEQTYVLRPDDDI